MDYNMIERQIADYMVEYGTKNTNSGLWTFDVDELATVFDISNKWIQEHDDGILSELYLREEVEDIEQTWAGESDWHLESFNVYFCTDFCPNYIDDEQEKDCGVDQYWFAETRWSTDDIIDIAKKKGIELTPQQAERWWRENESWFRSVLVKYGRVVLEEAEFNKV